MEQLSGLVHAITPPSPPSLKVAAAESSSDIEADSETEAELPNSTQSLDPVFILRTSLAELFSVIKQQMQATCMSYSQLCQVLSANCGTAGVDTGGEEREWVTRIFDRLKKAESTAKELSERFSMYTILSNTDVTCTISGITVTFALSLW